MGVLSAVAQFIFFGVAIDNIVEGKDRIRGCAIVDEMSCYANISRRCKITLIQWRLCFRENWF